MDPEDDPGFNHEEHEGTKDTKGSVDVEQSRQILFVFFVRFVSFVMIDGPEEVICVCPAEAGPAHMDPKDAKVREKGTFYFFKKVECPLFFPKARRKPAERSEVRNQRPHLKFQISNSDS